jgi:hypothetical protein
MKRFLRRTAERVLDWRSHHFVPKLMRAEEGVGPDFLCIGQQKAGTQWLYDQLRYHADFWMPPIKELRYFSLPPDQRTQLRQIRGHWDKLRNWNSRDLAYLNAAYWLSRREVDLEEYARMFNPKGAKITGDISPDYCALDAQCIRALAGRFPSIRTILFVRDPVERFWSALSMGIRHGRFAPLRHQDDWERVLAIIEHPENQALSFPSRDAERWTKNWPSGQFAVLFFDDLKSDPVRFRKNAISFLGGDPSKPSGHLPPSYNRKASFRKEVMSEAIRARLAQYFADELRACATTFGGPAANWLAKYGM